MRGARVALYYAPALDDPLWNRAADWLGRDPESGAARPQPPLPGIAKITAEPRLYGFHATLTPPMALRDGITWDEVMLATRAIAATVPAFDLPALAVADLHGFLALRETTPCPALQALADACVAGADHLRAPPDEAELARRRRGGLSSAQEANLLRWGYPYVFAAWTFHMTLTGRLSAEEHTHIRPAAEAWFATALELRRRVTEICLFVQRGAGTPLVLAERVTLAGRGPAAYQGALPPGFPPTD
jgi:putative phosphonate metabolism protein